MLVILGLRSLTNIEALQRITGAYPAWVRPRTSTITRVQRMNPPVSYNYFMTCSAYGNHNSLVRNAAGVRGLKIANWDLE